MRKSFEQGFHFEELDTLNGKQYRCFYDGENTEEIIKHIAD